MKFTISAASIAAHIPGRQRSEGRTISAARVRFMLANPDKGENRSRLIAALVDLGMTDEGAAKFVDNQKSEK